MMRRAPIGLRCYAHRRIVGSIAILIFFSLGCSGPIFRPQSPEAGLNLPPTPDVHLISEYTHAYGMSPIKVEAVSLVTGLAGTGSDPPPSPQRAELLAEMSRRDVAKPNEMLASSNTSLVLVRGLLRPGIQEGDHFDVEVRVPSRSETTSLRGGYLLSTRLTELAVLGEQIRQGNLLASAEGPVLVDPSADSKSNPAVVTQGRILGGGVAVKSRSLGLVIGHEYQSVRLSQQIASSVNHRFFTFVSGRKQGVATPKTDEFIDLIIQPRYKDNVARYIRIVRNISVNESPHELQDRLLLLEHQLADPLTAANAAIRLEAIGNEQAIGILNQNVAATDPEVRFYAAEALAYLDQTSAVQTLADGARDEPAFRVNSLAALSAMNDVTAYDALRSLLEVSSAETRYGAFRALWAMNQRDPFIRGERLGDQFELHVLDVPGPKMVHVTRSYRPEIVMFGKDQRFELPLVLDAGNNILVNGQSGDKITVSKFSPGAEPQQKVVSSSVVDVIRAIVDLGGTYPDVVQALQQAKKDGSLTSRFAVDALPQSGRQYDHDVHEHAERHTDDPAADSQDAPVDVSTPMPNLFTQER
ncbi:MAG TPA: flagellar basal body P-ring protein FlgI [Lacipirellulaceae bacterium]|jgi:flagellar basal body P-ring protein FlgI